MIPAHVKVWNAQNAERLAARLEGIRDLVDRLEKSGRQYLWRLAQDFRHQGLSDLQASSACAFIFGALPRKQRTTEWYDAFGRFRN